MRAEKFLAVRSSSRFSARLCFPFTGEWIDANLTTSAKCASCFPRLIGRGGCADRHAAAAVARRRSIAESFPMARRLVSRVLEIQRTLLEVDEQRRRLETSLEPVDSVLCLLAHDSSRIVASRDRRRSMETSCASLCSYAKLRVAPDSLEYGGETRRGRERRDARLHHV